MRTLLKDYLWGFLITGFIVCVVTLYVAFWMDEELRQQHDIAQKSGAVQTGVEIVHEGDTRIAKHLDAHISIVLEPTWEIVFHDTTTLSVGPLGAPEGNGEGVEVAVHNVAVDEQMQQIRWIEHWIEASNCPDCYDLPVLEREHLFRLDDRGALGTMINYFLFDTHNIFQITIFRDIPIDSILANIQFDL